jgi:hypothetical protein
MRNFLILPLLFFSFLSSTGFALGSADYVSVGKINPITLKKKGSGEWILPVLIKEGYHIQSHPASAPNLISTELVLESKDGVQPGEPTFPQPQKYRVMGMEQDITVYSGNVEIKLPVGVASKMKPGKVTLEGTLKCQACNDKTCFLPSKIPFSLSLVVKK